MKGELIMFKNYKKLYKKLVNEIERLWNGFNFGFSMGESEDMNERYEGYFNTLSDFYVYYLSKYKVHDKINNIKIINYKKRYLDIVHYIDYLYHEAMEEIKFYESNNEYINGFLDCVEDLLAIIKSE